MGLTESVAFSEVPMENEPPDYRSPFRSLRSAEAFSA